MFLIGLLKLYYLYRGPFLEVFADFDSQNFVDCGLFFIGGIPDSQPGNYPSSGLLSDPESFVSPIYINCLFILSSVSIFTKFED